MTRKYFPEWISQAAQGLVLLLIASLFGMIVSSVAQAATTDTRADVASAVLGSGRSNAEGQLTQLLNNWLGLWGTARLSVDSDKKEQGHFLFPTHKTADI